MIATCFLLKLLLTEDNFSADKNEMLSTEDNKLLMIAIFLLKIKYCYLLKITTSLLTIMKRYLLKIANCWKQHLLSNEDSVLLSVEDSKIQTNKNSNSAFLFKFYIHSSIQIPYLPVRENYLIWYVYRIWYICTRSGNIFFCFTVYDLWRLFLEINSFSNIYWTCYEVQFKCESLIIICEVYMLISIINQLIF